MKISTSFILILSLLFWTSDASTDLKDISALQILETHDTYVSKNAHVKTFEEITLAYVTPWNNRGYDIAKLFRGKFSHISPVWYNIEPHEPGQFKLSGKQDVDTGWIAGIRQTSIRSGAFIVPRFQFSRWTESDYMAVIQNQTISRSLAELIVIEIEEQGFDGMVLETGIPIHYLSQLIITLSRFLRNQSKQLYVVIPPLHVYHDREIVTASDLALIEPFVHGFSLMTYDYTASLNPGPNAPIEWIRENIIRLDPDASFRAKILLGLNMYGYDYGLKQDAITGNQYLDILRKHDPTMMWLDSEREHVFSYPGNDNHNHKVYYPTLHVRFSKD